jgi:hypothetical protein
MALTSLSTFGSIVAGEQAPVGERHRAEETGFRVRDRLHLAVVHLVAEDVRDTGVVRAAVEIASVRREDEALRDGLAEEMLRKRLQVARLHALQVVDPQELVAAHLGHGCGKLPAVG